MPRIGARFLLLSLCLGGLTGCQLPAARFAAGGPLDWDPPCMLALGTQVAGDSALKSVCHPAQTTWELVYESTDHLFAFLHGEIGKRFLLPLRGRPGPLAPERTLVARATEATLADDLLAAHIQFHTEGASSLVALERQIDQGEHSIDVLMFEWEDDELGQRIARRLMEKAGPHLRVRILVDGSSNLVFAHVQRGGAAAANRLLRTLAETPYIEVLRIRNPFGRFDHRKLVVVDGRAAWTGGRNFMRRSFFEDHDLSATLTGPLVAELQERFNRSWREQGGQESIVTCPQCTGPAPNAWGRVIDTRPGNHQLQETLYQAIDEARHYVYVENVYFTDSRLAFKLAQARRRGVDVRVVLTIQSNSAPINRSTRVLANRLFQAGIRVYLYPGMTHVKAAAVDGAWAYVGSGNFDALSLRHNHELGLVLQAGPALAELEAKLFHADCKDEWELREPLKVALPDYVCELLASLWL